MTKEELQQIAELLNVQKQEITEMVDAKLGVVSEKLDSMDSRLDGMDSRLDSMDSRLDGMEEYARQTRVLMEKQEHNIALIAEQYGDISLKLERVREIDDLRDRVRTLETVVRNHSVKLQTLDRAE